MVKKILGLIDSDKAYGTKLYEILCERYSNNFELLFFTKQSELEKYLEDNRLDYLIVSQDISWELEGDENYEKIILTGDKDKEFGNVVYKYVGESEILKKISMVLFADKYSSGSGGSDESMVIGVYSPIKRCFQTTFAVTLGQILSKDKKCLYLNFESFSGFDSLRTYQNDADIMDLVYYSTCEQESFATHLETIVEKIGNLSFVRPAREYFRYREVDRHKWVNLLNLIKEKTDYQVIILDLSENVCGLFDVLAECDKVYTIAGKDKVSEYKMLQYEGLIQSLNKGEITQKTQEVTIPIFRTVPEEYELLPYSQLGEYVKNMMMVKAG